MFPLFFNYFLRRAERYFETNRAAKITTVGLFLLVILFLSAGIFSFFLHGFRFLALTDYFSDAILLYLLELFMFTIFILTFASALITGLFGLFYGKDNVLLVVSPKFRLIPFLVLSRMFTASLWPLLIVVFPALVAMGLVYRLSFAGSLLSLFSLVLFIGFAVLSAMTLILLVAWTLLMLKKSFLRFESLALGAFLIASLLIIAVWNSVDIIPLDALFQAEAINIVTPDVAPIRQNFRALPSHPAALILFAASHDDLPQILGSLLVLFAMFCIMMIPFSLLKRFHLTLWQIFQENHFQKDLRERYLSGAISRSAGPLSAIFRKEVVIFFRNASGMIWFGFFCLIWLLQSASMFILNHQLSERPSTIPFFVIALQIAATIYFVSMFVLRFAFPAFSMEQKTSWILHSAPIDNGKIFFARIGFYVPLFALLGLLFTVLNTFIIAASATGSIIIFGSILLASVTVTSYGLALGALFPNFETDDPELLSTSLPGLTFIFTSLLYGGSVAYAVRNFFAYGESLPLALIIIFSLGFSTLCIVMPYRRISARE